MTLDIIIIIIIITTSVYSALLVTLLTTLLLEVVLASLTMNLSLRSQFPFQFSLTLNHRLLPSSFLTQNFQFSTCNLIQVL